MIAATDYVRAYPQLIAPYVDAAFVALGTDGFGRSDTRPALRKFFEIDRYQIVVAALHALVGEGKFENRSLVAAIEKYAIDTDRQPSWEL